MNESRSRVICVVVMMVACALVVLPSRTARAGNTDKTLSPFFFVQGGDGTVDRLPLEKTSVKVDISGVTADVIVRQTYRNTGKIPINAKYVFPASTRAAVHGMRMTVGERVIVAKIREREQAKKEFEAAKKAGKSASLLSQQRPNVFTMNVANIMPGDVIHVDLRYAELLVPTKGTYEFVYPTVVGPRYSETPAANAPESEKWVQSPFTPAGVAPTSKFNIVANVSTGIPLQALTSPSHKIDTLWPQKSLANVTLHDSEQQGGNRDFILRYKLAGKRIASGLLLYQGKKENFFLLMVQPPKRVTKEQIPAREFVFIVDVSGSMFGFPLDTTKALVRDLIGSLRPTDRFNLILFAGGAHVMSPRSVPATLQNINRAIRTLDAQRGGGGTRLLPALQEAMGMPHEEGVSRSFVVITDGYISAEGDVFAYIKSNLGKANVFSMGIGSSVNRYLVEGIAKAGMGEPFVITDGAHAPAAATRFREYVESPVLTDVKVKFGNFKAYDVEPMSIPDVLAERPVIVYGKYRGAPRGTISLTGVSGAGPYKKEFDVATVTPNKANRALVYLWARAKIADLSDFNFSRDSAQQKNEITRLGLKYSLLTKYTSFIAIHDVIRNAEGNAVNVKQPLPMPQGVSNSAISTPMGSGAEPELILLLALAGLMLVAMRYRVRKQHKPRC